MLMFSHGGHCCGISTLWGFYEGPDTKIEEHKAVKKNGLFPYDYVKCRDIGKSYTHPEQTHEERAARLIELTIAERPKGLIEAVLTSGKYNYDKSRYNPVRQIDVWGPILEKMGFVPVTTFRNSNSGCDVTVYHYAYGQ